VRRLGPLACAAAFALAPATADAAIVPGAPVDGPSADITANSVVQSDVAPDGTAAIAYLKGATPKVWVSRLVGGAWAPPQQAENLAGASTNPRIAVANGGKVVVTFANGGNVHAVVKPNAGAAFGTATSIGLGGQYGELDLAPDGNGYVAIKATPLLTAARLEGTTFTPVAGALNNDPTKEAGASDREAKVATRADGTGAVIVWSEDPGVGSVHVRTITGTTLGSIQDAKLASLDGALAAATDVIMPDVGIDATGTAWVVFRQFFTYGGMNFGRALARPLPPGGSLGAAQVLDSLANPPTENVEYPRIDVNAAGQGLTANALGTTFGIQATSLAAGTWTRLPAPVNPTANAAASFASPALGATGNGMVAWVHDPDGAGTEVDRILARTTLGGFGPALTLSDPALGDLQQFQIVSAAGSSFAVVGYVQGGAGAAAPRRVGAALVDLPAPGGNPAPLDATKPKLSKLRLSAKRFRIGTKLPSAAAVRTGTTIRYTLSEAAAVTLSFERVTRGRKLGKRCVKAKRSKRRRKACKRYAAVKPALTFANQAAGRRGIRFEGRLSRRKTLKPGGYRLSLRARDLAGNRSSPLRARITVLPRKPKRG
jgi:hypothetical protein